MTTREYVSRVVEVVKVTDGDTYWFRVSVPFRHQALVEIRLAGFDCPERTRGSAFEKAEAKRATGVAALFLTRPNLWVRTEPDPDDFGRWLGEVWAEGDDGTTTFLGDLLRSQRLASVWPTRWREEFDQGSTA